VFSYRNLGRVKDKGLELGVDAAVTNEVNAFVNYSFQANPVIEGFDPLEANKPARHRFNAGFNFSRNRLLGNLSVSYTGSAYWQDVLDLRYAGTTDAYTLVNGGVGVRWMVGDVIRRQVVGEARVSF